MRHLREIARGIDVAFECGRRFDAMLEAIESRGKGGRKSEIGICIRPCRPALDSQRLPVADDAKAGRSVIEAPGDSGRRERAGDISLVRRRIGRIEREELADVMHPAAEEPAEGGGALNGAELLLSVEHRSFAVAVP